MRIGLVVLLGVLAVPGESQQTVLSGRADNTSAISGRVIGTVDRRPVRRVVVTLTGSGLREPQQQLSKDDGAFRFDGVPAGRYTLTAEKPAYVKAVYGSERPGGQASVVVVAPSGTVSGLIIGLTPGGVISGTVTDENGFPLASSQVEVWRVKAGSGADKRYAIVDRATTDDRGVYRAFGLPPGTYTVSTSGSSGFASVAAGILETSSEDIQLAVREIRGDTFAGLSREVNPPSKTWQVAQERRYHPGVPELNNALTVTVGPGQERLGVDISVSLVRAAGFRATVLDSLGRPIANATIVLEKGATRECWASPGFLRPNSTGQFSVSGLAPASYRLVARSTEIHEVSILGAGQPRSASIPVWAETEFMLEGGETTDVLLRLVGGSSIVGRLSVSGDPRPDFEKVRISLGRSQDVGCGEPVALPAVSAQDDGSFEVKGVPPGRYDLKVSTDLSTWVVRAAMLGDRDILDDSLEVLAGAEVRDLTVLLTNRPNEIRGWVSDRMGRVSKEYSVIAFSADRRQWHPRSRRISQPIRVDTDGGYRIVGLPSGEYFVAVVSDVDRENLEDPAFLELLVSAAIRIELREGESKTLDLKLS